MGRRGAANGKEVKSRPLMATILRALERCRSLRSHHHHGAAEAEDAETKLRPEGYIAVCVGPARERFVVRAECVNHPLFRALLEEAEMEFGHSNTGGPLVLPCGVELFRSVLWEMEQEAAEAVAAAPPPSPLPQWCKLGRGGSDGAGGYHRLLSPARPLVIGRV